MRDNQFDVILNVITTRWGHSIDQIFTPKSGKLVSEWRMLFFYVTYSLKIPNIITTQFFHEKGYYINHASISNAVTRLKNKLKTDEILQNEINAIIAECLRQIKYGKKP